MACDARERRHVAGKHLSTLTTFAHKSDARHKQHAGICARYDIIQKIRAERARDSTALCALMVIGILAVYAIDVILFGPVAEFFARRAFPNHPVFAEAARFILPAAILCLEIMIGIQVHQAAERFRYDREGRMSLWGWAGLALLLTLSMPAAVITVFFASAFRFPPWVSTFLLITLLALSFAAHISIVFGGRLSLEAKHYLGDALRCGYLRIRMMMTGSSSIRMRRHTIDAFRNYREQFRLLPEGEEFGPFDSITRNIVNEAFGYEIIPIPAPPGSSVPRGYLPRPGE
jgi:hypothetical protein